MISENPKRRMEEDVQTKKNTVTVKSPWNQKESKPFLVETFAKLLDDNDYKKEEKFEVDRSILCDPVR